MDAAEDTKHLGERQQSSLFMTKAIARVSRFQQFPKSLNYHRSEAKGLQWVPAHAMGCNTVEI